MTSPKIEAVVYRETIKLGDDVFADFETRLWELPPHYPMPKSEPDIQREPLYSQQTVDALLAEVERYKVAWQEFNDRTEWVQQTAQPRELGKHRADVLRERIERAEAQAEANRRDAERYRFLRALPECCRDTDWLWNDQGDALDEQVDAAIGGRDGS